MTVLPRSMTSPMVRPSAGTGSSVLASATIWPASVGYGTPCRATMAACCAGPSASHASGQTQGVEGPCTSVSPYRWVTRKPISLIALMTLAGGDEPPVSISTTWSNLTRCSTGALISIASTVGAPHIWVTPCSAIRRKTSGGATLRRHTWGPALAGTHPGECQPLQWDIGQGQRYNGGGGTGQART